MRDRETPLPIPCRARESSSDVSEERRFEHVGGNRAGIDGHERLGGAGRLLVDRPRDQLLSGAALARYKYCRTGRRNLVDHLEDIADREGCADQSLLGARLSDLRAQSLVLAQQPATLESLADFEEQLGVVPRLCQEVRRSASRGFDGCLDGSVSGEHHHGKVWVASADLRERVKARPVGEHQIQQDQVARFSSDCIQAAARGGRGQDFVAHGLEQQAQAVDDRGLVVDDQNPTAGRRRGRIDSVRHSRIAWRAGMSA